MDRDLKMADIPKKLDSFSTIDVWIVIPTKNDKHSCLFLPEPSDNFVLLGKKGALSGVKLLFGTLGTFRQVLQLKSSRSYLCGFIDLPFSCFA